LALCGVVTVGDFRYFLRFWPLLLKVRPFMARLKLTFPSISDPFWPFLYFIWRPFFSIFLSLFWPFLYFIWRPFFSIFLSLFWPFSWPGPLWSVIGLSFPPLYGHRGLFLLRLWWVPSRSRHFMAFFVIYLRPSLWFRRGLFRVPGIWSSTCR